MATVQTATQVADSAKRAATRSGFLSFKLTSIHFTNQWEKNSTSSDSPCDRIISLEEVSHHDHVNDCWIVLYDKVYDITAFFENHPGGSDVLLEHAGRDATVAFRGTGHSAAAAALLKPLGVGMLPPEERIYRKDGGIQLTGMPD